MESLVLTFVVLNAFLIGGGLGLAGLLRSTAAQAKSDRTAAQQAKKDCLELTQTIAEAHNGLGKRIIQIEDKLKGWDMRLAAKPTHPFPGTR